MALRGSERCGDTHEAAPAARDVNQRAGRPHKPVPSPTGPRPHGSTATARTFRMASMFLYSRCSCSKSARRAAFSSMAGPPALARVRLHPQRLRGPAWSRRRELAAARAMAGPATLCSFLEPALLQLVAVTPDNRIKLWDVVR
jgi:hypothetical protein